MEGISILLCYMASALIGVFKLSGSDTLDYFFDVFNGRGVSNGNSVSSGAADAGIFGQAYKLFLICALSIIFLSMIYQIVKAFFGPLVSAESPSRVIIKSGFFAVLSAMSQNIVALVFEITQIPYDAISSGIPNIDMAYLQDKIINHFDATEGPTWIDVITTVNPVMSISFWSTVLSIVLFMMLLKNFMALALELAERYLMLGLLTIIAPLCIACGAIRGVEDVFKNWLSWIINGCIVMIFSTFFLAVFIGSFTAQADVPYLLLWICWLKSGQKIDEHMNALGLKTAKTGGFGMDVMGAMAAGFPAALTAMNKMAGTNVGIPFSRMMGAKSDGRANPDDKSIAGALGFPNLLTGQKPGGLLGIQSRGIGAIIKGADKKIEEKTGKKGQIESLLYNTQKKAAGITNTIGSKITGKDKPGVRSSLSAETLNKMAKGEMPMPRLGTEAYQNAAKDILAMKAGNDFVNKLTKGNFDISKIGIDKEGNLNFSATDNKGNTLVGTLKDAPQNADETYGGHILEGEDGLKHEFVGQTNENKSAPAELQDLFNDKISEDKQHVVGASNETMEENGFVNASDKNHVGIDSNGTVDGQNASDFNKIATADEVIGENNISDVDGEKTLKDASGNVYTLSSEANEDGNFVGKTEDGQEAIFKANDDNTFTKLSEAKEFNQEEGISTETHSENISADNVINSDGVPIQAKSADGVNYNLESNGDGTFKGINAAGGEATFESNEDGSLTMTQTRSYATGTDGQIFEVNSNAVHDSAIDINGNSQNIDTSAEATRHENGTITAKAEDGSLVELRGSYGDTTVQSESNSNSFVMDSEQGFSASMDDNNSLHISAVNRETGEAENINTSSASVSINGQELDLNQNFSSRTTSDGNVVFSGVDKNNNKCEFTQNDLSNAKITAGTTTLNTIRSADVQAESGNYANTMNFENASKPVIVQSSDGEFFKTTNQNRYDADGHLNPNGLYMQTTDAKGIPSYVQVATENGNVPTYNFKSDANSIKFRNDKESTYENYSSSSPAFKEKTTHSYRNPKQGEAATHCLFNNNVYELWKDEGVNYQNSKNLPQHYVALKGTNAEEKYAVCMDKAIIENGRVVPDKNEQIPIVKNGKLEYVNASELHGYKSENSQYSVVDYIKVKDNVNGAAHFLNNKEGQVLPQVVSDTYFCGVRTNMNLSEGTASVIMDKEGFPTDNLLYENGGEQYILYPKGTNVSKCSQGTWTEFNGTNYFMEPLPSNHMNKSFSNLGFDMSKNYRNMPIDTSKTPGFMAYAKQYGIPGDAENITLSSNKDCVCIQYTYKGNRMAVTSLPAEGFQGETICNLNEVPIAYRYAIRKGASVPLPKMRDASKFAKGYSKFNRKRGSK